MPGLLNQPDPRQQAPEQPQQPQSGQQVNQEAAPTGNLAAQYEKAQLYVEKLAAHPTASEKLADMIAGGESLEAGLGEAAAFVLMRIEAQLQIADEVKLELIGDIIEVVFEIAGEMGVIEVSDITEEMVQAVMSLGTQRYAEMHEQAGMPLDINEARGELEELERSGAINEARSAMPNDAESLDQLLTMARQGG